MRSQEASQKFVVIARNVDDARAFPTLPQYFLNNIIVELRPIPRTLQPPSVSNVADQINGLCIIVPKEIKQQVSLATTGPQMHI